MASQRVALSPKPPRQPTMPPKILAVSNALAYSGAPLALYHLIAALGDRYRFELVCPAGSAAHPLAADYAAIGVPIVDHVEAKGYDLILANTISSAPPVIGAARVTPVVWWIHEDRIGLGLLLSQPRFAEAFALAAAIVFPSRHLQEVTYRPWVDSRREAVRIIPNTAHLDAADLPPFQGTSDEPFRIVQIGYQGRIKGQDLTIEALRLLDDDRLHVDFVGRRSAIETEIAPREIGHRLTWHGELPPAQTRTIFRRADLVCQPSREETQSVAILEAMAFGKPVVASDLPGIRDLVCHGTTGLLSPVGDYRVLAGNIAMLRNDPVLREELGRNGRQRFTAHFSPVAHRQAFATLFDSLLNGERPT